MNDRLTKMLDEGGDSSSIGDLSEFRSAILSTMFTVNRRERIASRRSYPAVKSG